MSPFVLSPPELNQLGQLCWTVSTKIPILYSPCNTMDFYKLMVPIREYWDTLCTRCGPRPPQFLQVPRH